MLNGKSREPAEFRVPIITYHSIDESGSVISTARDVFARQISTLANAGYAAITLRELVSRMNNRSSLPERAVVLTFDDGFKNFYSEAFPILNDHGYRATVFLVTDFCGKHNDWAGNPPKLPRSEILKWSEVRELSGNGVEFGSHTKTHPDLTRTSAAVLEDEILNSKSALDDALGTETVSFAYPFGRMSEATRAVVADNFKAAVSTVLGKVTPRSDLFELERVDAYYLSDQRILDRIETPLFDNYMRVRQILRTAKSFAAKV
ncbi:MAG TPA: polysaccharide deacetylase family protein [Pyrinomonadaceae bacterium]|nr:polysaccharide deacetylase family protein [Pyrinomonadaceae bacterium]